MEKNKIRTWPSAGRLAVIAYLILLAIAFINAAWKSYDKTGFDHNKTQTYYLGDDSEESLQFPKEKSQLIAVSHVHTFSMAMTFLTLWILTMFTGFSQKSQAFWILISFSSILFYNLAPFVTRYYSVAGINLFTLGGFGMFLSFAASSFMITYESLRKS